MLYLLVESAIRDDEAELIANLVIVAASLLIETLQ
jgi:hypothetical protein